MSTSDGRQRRSFEALREAMRPVPDTKVGEIVDGEIVETARPG